MKRALRLYGLFLKQHFKVLIEYRTDFIIGILSFLVTQAAGVLFIWSIFLFTDSLMGWSRNEILLIYAMFQLPRGIDHLLTDNVWLLSRHIRLGTFDRYLTKPINVLYHLIIERFQFEALGEIIVGIALLIYVTPFLTISWSVPLVAAVSFLVIEGAVIYSSIKLITSTIAFWIRDSLTLMTVVYDLSSFVKNPLSIFPKAVQWIFTFIIPFAFTSYFPSAILLGKEPLLFYTIVGGIVSLLLVIGAYRFWLFGLKHYEATGT